MAARKSTSKATTEQVEAQSTADAATREWQHQPPTDVEPGAPDHAEKHNVLGRAVSELQSVVGELEAKLAALGAPESAGGDESPADSAGDSDPE
ncbi:hypothetical protein [uncultured Aeromicrobium sp.]|uniref:hypothetical protein n=1 Tax=uncultured Aeromicrobium sp. TaxID=337820 RepID=UPI0025FC3A28|nr:hypothetical protein [uncultured Aeromicrobium sp.]